MESQKVYTEPTIFDVTSSLNNATSSLENGLKLPVKTEINEWFNENRQLQRRYMTRGNK
jgi:hypothetical protein